MIEQLLISRVHPQAIVFCSCSNTQYRELFLPRAVYDVRVHLPITLSDLGRLLVFIETRQHGSFVARRKNAYFREQFQIRMHRVLEALRYLKDNNEYFRPIELDQANITSYGGNNITVNALDLIFGQQQQPNRPATEPVTRTLNISLGDRNLDRLRPDDMPLPDQRNNPDGRQRGNSQNDNEQQENAFFLRGALNFYEHRPYMIGNVNTQNLTMAEYLSKFYWRRDQQRPVAFRQVVFAYGKKVRCVENYFLPTDRNKHEKKLVKLLDDEIVLQHVDLDDNRNGCNTLPLSIDRWPDLDCGVNKIPMHLVKIIGFHWLVVPVLLLVVKEVEGYCRHKL